MVDEQAADGAGAGKKLRTVRPNLYAQQYGQAGATISGEGRCKLKMKDGSFLKSQIRFAI